MLSAKSKCYASFQVVSGQNIQLIFYLRGGGVPYSQMTISLKTHSHDNLLNLHRVYWLPFDMYVSYLDIQKTCQSYALGQISIITPK